ncbi:hypothetical protein ADK76_20315 [Streptomyces griseoflavus]|uniref:Uma2 family endonuclease n=1 Tax=Streptomyces rimosus TaxID=1927 RepID=UPI00067E1F65|nr:Uma2 family endonuclease [Streptomyces rimosus]KOG56201.1 hypothetical protein ADK76_20315 [Streptomyces griseoflavus]
MGDPKTESPEYGHEQRATPQTWMHRPTDGWTYNQVKELELPFDWELIDGTVVPRGVHLGWHDLVRDNLFFSLRSAQAEPFGVGVARWAVFDGLNIPKPDFIVYDTRGLKGRSLDFPPVENIVLAVEVVSPTARLDDRYGKHGLYAQAVIPSYWRVERDENDLPVVHEFWLHHETGVYAPSPERPVHTGKLVTSVPFPVDIDLRDLTEA